MHTLSMDGMMLPDAFLRSDAGVGREYFLVKGVEKGSDGHGP